MQDTNSINILLTLIITSASVVAIDYLCCELGFEIIGKAFRIFGVLALILYFIWLTMIIRNV